MTPDARGEHWLRVRRELGIAAFGDFEWIRDDPRFPAPAEDGTR